MNPVAGVYYGYSWKHVAMTRRISVLIPTRARLAPCAQAIESLATHASDPTQIEYLLRADDDDATPYGNFASAQTHVIRGPRHGYGGMPHYLAELVAVATAPWLLIWNDDALMQTRGWDAVPTAAQLAGMKLLCTRTQEERDRPMSEPYGSQFMFVPRRWFQVLGHMGQHQHADTWLWIVGMRTGLRENVDVDVLHDRADLTGGNDDQTFRERVYVGLSNDDPRLAEDAAKLRAACDG